MRLAVAGLTGQHHQVLAGFPADASTFAGAPNL
jgi:hypothetical protein